MKQIWFIPVLLTFCIMPQAAAQQKYALVIGNGNYTNFGDLRNPVNDADDMEAALKSLGWTVDKIPNGSLEPMEEAVIRLKNRLSVSQDAYGLFFYSGHGVQSNGENYLIPRDANISSENMLRQRAMSLGFVLEELNDAGNALNVVILDACRDFPAAWTKSVNKGLSGVKNAPADSIIVYATSAGSTASDGEGRNGLFTSHLLNNLKIPGLEVREVFRRTHADVRTGSGGLQRPAVYDQSDRLAYLGTSPENPVLDRFVQIPEGTFMMGSPASEPERSSNEVQHQVTVSSFLMGKYQVTQKEYQEVMGTNPSNFKGDTLPVENVSWYDAIEYCNARSRKEGLTPAYTIDKTRSDPNNQNEYDEVRWVVMWNRNANGYRLPTEAEWEYACRAGTATPFSTGNNITTGLANYDGNNPYNSNAKGEYRGKTTAVGSFAPNNWGLYDMHGNVWEWCWDWYGAYSAGAQTDPEGAVSGALRVRRGGSWLDDGQFLRSGFRRLTTPSGRISGLGFRLVCPQ